MIMPMAIQIDEHGVHLLISKNLKRLRLLRNISQLALSAKAELSHNYINDIENCKKGVSVRTLVKLSNALNVEPYQFFLPDNMPITGIDLYVEDLRNSLNMVITEVTNHYVSSGKNEN